MVGSTGSGLTDVLIDVLTDVLIDVLTGVLTYVRAADASNLTIEDIQIAAVN